MEDHLQPLVEEEEDVSHTPQTRRTPTRAFYRSVGLILVLTVSTAIVLVWNPSSSIVGRSPIPRRVAASIESRIFMGDEIFNPANHTRASDEAWAGVHKRFVAVQDASSYGLPRTVPGTKPGTSLYAIAAFHQLHCLRLLRLSWLTVLEQGREILDSEGLTIPGHPPYKDIHSHVGHCFDYIRQSLMCHADMTLEPFLESDGRTLRPQGSSGWGVPHICNDYDGLVEWVERHQDVE